MNTQSSFWETFQKVNLCWIVLVVTKLRTGLKLNLETDIGIIKIEGCYHPSQLCVQTI